MKIERVRVDIANCTKTWPNGVCGLQPTSLTIEPGEVVALLGPSGCGKTTLLRIVAGLETPDAGSRIFFGDTEVTHVSTEKRRIGMVFQHYALFPQMTVAANIGYGLLIQGVDEARRREIVGELIDLVRLNGFEQRRPAQLSGGQRQRVALARAVASQPRVLLLDEPLTALDAKLKESVRDELADLQRRLNITALHVTHDQQEALAIADRLAVMHAGRIVQIGDGETLYRTPGHPFVATFLGRANHLQRDAAARQHNRIAIGGLTLTCPPDWQEHERFLLRPEDIEVGVPASDWGRATVLRRSFMGDRVQLTLETIDQPPLLADVARDHRAQAGDTVGLRVAAERLMPYAEEHAA